MSGQPVGPTRSDPPRPDPPRPDLATLTGVRSGKGSYYRAYVRSDERLQQAVRAMDSISRALVRTVQGPRGLLEEVVRAVGTHLAAEWVVLALADGQLPGARPRFLVLHRDGVPVDDERLLPPPVRRELGAVRAGHARHTDDSGWVRVPMSLEGRPIGSLAARHGLAVDPEPSDLSVLRILANQAAVSLHTSEQYQAGVALHRRAQRVYDEAQAQARDLALRTDELRRVEQRLLLAHQREIVDAERHRIARELHDSVTQYVLSAGMQLEVARGELAALGAGAATATVSVATAKQLAAQAVEQLRRAIYALSQSSRETVSTLPELLADVAEHHRGHLKVQVRVEGDVQGLPADADHEIARAVAEALFNTATHARATRAVVRLRYAPDELRVHVADDGCGDPTTLSRVLRVQRTDTSGRHRGLANIESRVLELGGRIAFRRARLGGVRIELRVPLPIDLPATAGTISGLLDTAASATPRPSVPPVHDHPGSTA